jgi:hypothetical protein
MITGYDVVGFAAVDGPTTSASSAALTLPTVSRIMAGGWSNARPAAVAVLGVDLLWDTEDIITWDDGTDIGTEA